MVAAAVAAMSACLFAADGEAAPKAGEGAQPAPQAAEAAPRPARPAGMRFNRAAFEERMKKRQEERRAKVAEILKAAGLPEDKVAAAVDEIDKVYTKRPAQRPPRPGAPNGQRRRPAPRPQGAPAPQ